MASDEEDEVATPGEDPLGLRSGPRRATFTPPPQPGDDQYDDDALAEALAASFPGPITGTIPVVPPPGPQSEPPAAADPAPASEPPLPPPEPASWVPTAPTTAPEVDSPQAEQPQAEQPPVEQPRAEQPRAEQPQAERPPVEQPPWASAPAPDPSQAVALPQGPPQRPVRRSLPDSELIGWVEGAASEPGGTLNVIEGLQSQLNLRIQEAREFSDWEQTMLADGSPGSLAAVEDARPEFTGVLPDLGAALSGGAIPAEAPQAPAPDPTTEMPPSAPTFAEPAEEAPPFAPPPPRPSESAPVDEYTLPTGWFVPPVEVDAPSVPLADHQAPVTGPFLLPDERLEAWPPPDFGEETPPAEPAPEPPGEPEPGPDLEAPVEEAPHFLPEPSSEPLLPTASVLIPPPLVEPPPFGTSGVPGPPLDEIDDEIDGEIEDVLEADALLEDQEAPSAGDPFNDLLNGEEPPAPEPEVDRPIEELFIEPLPAVAGGELTETGSVAIVDQAYEIDSEDDAVDETDRVTQGLGPVTVDTAGIAIVPPVVQPPSGPISTVRVPEDENVLSGEELQKPRVFSLEAAGVEPTPLENRVGRAARLFWLWFAANASLLSIGLGAAIFGLGMSLRQSIVATLAGIALSFFPLGLSTLAGKRSGQPTMVVSRATFGLVGNVLPSILSLISRLFWGAVLLWFLTTSVSGVLIGAELDGGIGERILQLILFGGGLLLAFVIALFGYGLLAKVQLIFSVLSGILLIGLIAMTFNYVSIQQALSTQDGPWILVITGAVLVFSFVGLAWANSGGDLARYQRFGSSGAVSMLWATIGATLPAFILIAYGALLAASNKGIASGFVTAPLDTLALMLPSWYPLPLLLSVGLSLLSGIAISLYSGGFSLQAAGVRVPRPLAVVIVTVLLGALTAVLLLAFGGSMLELFRDAATTIAVPIAAWAGIFAAELMIRNRRFETMSLMHRGGIYADVRWANLIALVLITVVGWAFTTASVGWLSWQGFGFSLLGVGAESDLAGTDLGVLVALVLGILVPIVIGIPAIRAQESSRPTSWASVGWLPCRPSQKCSPWSSSSGRPTAPSRGMRWGSSLETLRTR